MHLPIYATNSLLDFWFAIFVPRMFMDSIQYQFTYIWLDISSCWIGVLLRWHWPWYVYYVYFAEVSDTAAPKAFSLVRKNFFIIICSINFQFLVSVSLSNYWQEFKLLFYSNHWPVISKITSTRVYCFLINLVHDLEGGK